MAKADKAGKAGKSSDSFLKLNTFETVLLVKELYGFKNSVALVCDSSYVEKLFQTVGKISSLYEEVFRNQSFHQDVLGLFSVDRVKVSITSCLSQSFVFDGEDERQNERNAEILESLKVIPCVHAVRRGQRPDAEMLNNCAMSSSLQDEAKLMLLASGSRNSRLTKSAHANGLPVLLFLDNKKILTTLKIDNSPGKTLFKSMQQHWEKKTGQPLVEFMVGERSEIENKKKVKKEAAAKKEKSKFKSSQKKTVNKRVK